jgi:hypothetical protein
MSSEVSVENGESLFLEIIGKLNAGDVLPHIVLVGSWVFYLSTENILMMIRKSLSCGLTTSIS